MGVINYNSVALKVQKVIEDNGKAITLVEKSKSIPADPAKSWRSDDTVTPGENTVEVTAVEDQFSSSEVNGSSVRLGDKKFLVAAKSVSTTERPRLGEYDIIRDGSETWRIKKMDPVEPGSVPVVFTFHVRKLGRESG